MRCSSAGTATAQYVPALDTTQHHAAVIIHTEEVIGSSPVSPTMKTPGYPGVFVFQLLAHSVLCGQIGRLCGIGVRERSSRERPGPLSVHLTVCIDALCDVAG